MVGKVEPSLTREEAWAAFHTAFVIGGAVERAMRRGERPDPRVLAAGAASMTHETQPGDGMREVFDLWWSEREAGGKP